MQTYLFYDLETTGLNKAFDQVLQFAAIRTDLKLKEIERYEYKIKLNRDVIPSPHAVLTHGIGISEMLDGITEWDAIRSIHQLLNTPGTISLGYNTLGFDDEFLRFSFYRNLLPPYTHQYANQCSRLDIYPITVMHYLFKNEIIAWPKRQEKISLKLEDLNGLNQWVKGQAHNALVDVEATIALASQFIKDEPMWNFLCGYFNKQKETARIQNLKNNIVLLIDGVLGANKNYQCPALYLGQHRHYKNQTVWLRLDEEKLSLATPDTIKECTWSFLKKYGEPPFILPYEQKYSHHLAKERLQLAESNFAWLQAHDDLFAKITDHHLNFSYPKFPNADSAASLYLNGFWSFEDEHFCKRFHQVAPKDKARLINEISNPTLQELAIRIMGKHFPEAMTQEQNSRYEAYIQKCFSNPEEQYLIDYKGQKRYNHHLALKDLQDLKAIPRDDKTMRLIFDLETYLNSHFSVSL